MDGFELGEVFFKREYPDKVLERMDNPAVCAFSCYVWNQKYNLMMAKAIKDKYPNCVIEFGGPQVDASWSEKYDFIDSAICGYGELAFQELHLGRDGLGGLGAVTLACGNGPRKPLSRGQWKRNGQ